ncbi:hypothetical protein V5N11_017824 [Cardamine amara subsp. amara]|uniref:Uncharacterized protein n=1 Tax=Cardamine amara subsp. amara TaxID=228776 RepID=A0ABD0ZZ89_CARAN
MDRITNCRCAISKWKRRAECNSKTHIRKLKEKFDEENTIPALVNSDGVEQLTEGSKGEIAVDYFRSLFMSTKPVHATELLTGMELRVTETMNRELTKPLTSDEIWEAAFGIKSNKALRGDGMTGQFF